jgi:hypothetical protein
MHAVESTFRAGAIVLELEFHVLPGERLPAQPTPHVAAGRTECPVRTARRKLPGLDRSPRFLAEDPLVSVRARTMRHKQVNAKQALTDWSPAK